MSILAGLIVAYAVVTHGVAPQADETTPAFLWQALMLLQAPIVLFFAVRWLPTSPRRGALVLFAQIAAAAAAAAPVFLLGW